MNKYLLIGIDSEGDTREVPCNTLDKAIKIAVDSSEGVDGWQSWFIYGNHPTNEAWGVLIASDIHHEH